MPNSTIACQFISTGHCPFVNYLGHGSMAPRPHAHGAYPRREGTATGRAVTGSPPAPYGGRGVGGKGSTPYATPAVRAARGVSLRTRGAARRGGGERGP